MNPHQIGPTTAGARIATTQATIRPRRADSSSAAVSVIGSVVVVASMGTQNSVAGFCEANKIALATASPGACGTKEEEVIEAAAGSRALLSQNPATPNQRYATGSHKNGGDRCPAVLVDSLLRRRAD